MAHNKGTIDEAMREMTLEEQLVQHREVLTNEIRFAEVTEKKAAPPVVQEIVLARRAMEDARMRMGVALTRVRGQDPWSSGPITATELAEYEEAKQANEDRSQNEGDCS